MLKFAGISIFTLAVAVSPLLYAGPQVISDMGAGKQWTIAEDVQVEKADCTRWRFLVSA